MARAAVSDRYIYVSNKYKYICFLFYIYSKLGNFGNMVNPDILACFQEDMATTYIANITNKQPFDGLWFSMFKSIWCPENTADPMDHVYAERLNIGGKNGLKLGRCGGGADADTDYRLVGFDIEAEDPRLVFVHGQLYVVFICISIYPGLHRGIGISTFDHWDPVYLRVRNMPFNPTEKNWSPFVLDGCLHFVYSHDPLMVIKYDMNPEGFCDIVFLQAGVQLPIDTTLPAVLRGGSNLIHYRGKYYIGACHDRIGFHGRINYLTHIILLDVENWEIVYVSKPVAFRYRGSEFAHIGDDIFYHITDDTYMDSYALIQSPSSLNRKSENEFYITVHAGDSVSLLYEIVVDIPDAKLQKYANVGDIQHKTYTEVMNIYYAGAP